MTPVRKSILLPLVHHSQISLEEGGIKEEKECCDRENGDREN
jgi:hypothetical protein